MVNDNPTPYQEINALLCELLLNARTILGSHLVGMYLEGSLTGSDFDQDSDIDFVIVTDQAISPETFAKLQAMHDCLAKLDTAWAIQLEGSYISKEALRYYDPAKDTHPNIERGIGERLKMVEHTAVWNIHRYILRERGITLVGPAPETLIDAVSPDTLRQAMYVLLDGWAKQLLLNPSLMKQRGYQSYVVLSLCRVLYTIQFGNVVSKLAALRWAQEQIGDPWKPLMERAWIGRHASNGDSTPEEITTTVEFIRFVIARGKAHRVP